MNQKKIKDLEYWLKQCKIPKKQRERIILESLAHNVIDHDIKLYQAKASKIESEPSEQEEQIEFVKWWRQTYPQHKIIMLRNDGSRTNQEKPMQMLMGLEPGASDLEIPWINVYLEMKRKKTWRQSEMQKEFQAYIESLGKKYVLGLGAEDAKRKILEVINAK